MLCLRKCALIRYVAQDLYRVSMLTTSTHKLLHHNLWLIMQFVPHSLTELPFQLCLPQQVHTALPCTDLAFLAVQARFIMFADEMRPGRTFWRDDIFDPTQTADGPFYNVPGYLDNFKGTKKNWRAPLFRGNSSMDPADILNPTFDDCSVPIVWWPWWPYNPGDFFLSSLAPYHAMQYEGVIDHNVRYTPVMDGLTRPGYMQWYALLLHLSNTTQQTSITLHACCGVPAW